MKPEWRLTQAIRHTKWGKDLENTNSVDSQWRQVETKWMLVVTKWRLFKTEWRPEKAPRCGAPGG
jgi:hypothetical protein